MNVKHEGRHMTLPKVEVQRRGDVKHTSEMVKSFPIFDLFVFAAFEPCYFRLR